MPETIGPSPDDINSELQEETPKETDVISAENLPPPPENLWYMNAGSIGTPPPDAKPLSVQDQELLQQAHADLDRVFTDPTKETLASQLTKHEMACLERLTLPEIQADLQRLNTDHYLLGHQTWHDTAERIIQQQQHFNTGPNVAGTAWIARAEDLSSVMPELDKKSQGERERLTHKGADTMIVLALPRGRVDQEPGRYVSDKIDSLVSRGVETKNIPAEWGLPQKQFMVTTTGANL